MFCCGKQAEAARKYKGLTAHDVQRCFMQVLDFDTTRDPICLPVNFTFQTTRYFKGALCQMYNK